jgi:fatty-acyl-CoA synthase
MTRSYHHRGGSEPLLGATIPEHFAAIAEQYGEREALVSCHQSRRLRYRELAEQVDVLARGLAGSGFGRGDRVGVWATNQVEWYLLQLATARIGSVLVNVNPASRVPELAHALKRSEVQGLFVMPKFRSSDYVAMLLELIPALEKAEPDALRVTEFPELRRVVVFDPGDPANTARPAAGFTTWQEVIAAGESVSPDALEALTRSLDPDDPINIQYTSGTTGFPKAVVLTHHNLLNNAYFAARQMQFTGDDRLCVAVPFYHCFGMVLANLLCVSVGACTVVPCEHFDAERVLEAIDRERCSAVHGVPSMFIAELDHPRFGEFDLGHLRTGIMAGAPCPEELMTRVMRDMCPEILIGYGETEASPLTHLTTPDDSLERRTQTVGRNLPHQEVKIADSEGRAAALGEIGEVCFRGYHVMRGYYADPEATAGAIDESGWLHSGDLGTMDEDGYVRITGRTKEMIIRGGENIYPAEIEAVLFRHPKVAQTAVFGVPDDFYGEQIMAWIQTRPGETLEEEEVQDFVREHLAHFKVPKYVRFVDDFPMTVTGKLQKFKMRETAIAELERAR